MIRHVVLWKLKAEVKVSEEIYRKTVDQIRENYRVLKENMPLIRNMEIYESVKTGKDFYEIGTLMDFDSLEDLELFQKSDAHKEPKAKAFCDAVRECKAVIDFEFQPLCRS